MSRLPYVKSRVREYKEDNSEIEAWLLQAAMQCGFVRKSSSATASSSSAASTKSGASTAKKEPLIRISEYEPMANLIAKNASRIHFPARIKAKFSRVLDLRTDVNQDYASLNRPQDRKSTKTHGHFITVLRKAYDALSPFTTAPQKKTAKKAKAKAPQTDPVHVQNAFSKLHVEDTGDAADATASSSEPKIIVSDPPPVEVERSEEDILLDFKFEIMLFLRELGLIRGIVKQVWEDYATGKLDIIVASLTTNIAIDLARNAEADLEELLVRPAKFPASKFPVWSLPATLYLLQSADFEMTPRPDWVTPISAEAPIAMGEVNGSEEFAFYPVFFSIRYFVQGLRSVPKGAILDRRIERLPELVSNRKAHIDTLRTQNLMPQYQVVLQTWMDLKVCKHDEISSGMQYILDRRSIVFWAVFGIQLLLDIRKIMGSDRSTSLAKFPKARKPFDDLQNEVRTWQERLKTQGAFIANDLEDPEGATELVKLLYQDLKEAALDDDFKLFGLHNSPNVKAPSTARPAFWKLFENEEFYFLKRHPVRCGLMKHHLYSNIHRLSLRGDFPRELVYLAHLYNAGRILVPSSPAWPDLELILYRQGNEGIFRGERPQKFAAAKTQLDIARGKSIANGRIDKKKVCSVRSPRFMGNILSDQMEAPTDGREKESIYRALQRFVCDKSNHRRLYRQCNASKEDGQKPFQLQKEPEYSELLQDLSEYWLKADLIDLYFDWGYFHEIYARGMSQTLADLSLQQPDIREVLEEDPYLVAHMILDQAAKGRTGPLSTFCLNFQTITHEVYKSSGRRKMYKGDMCLNTLAGRYDCYDFFTQPGGPLLLTKTLYQNWDRQLLDQSAFVASMRERASRSGRKLD